MINLIVLASVTRVLNKLTDEQVSALAHTLMNGLDPALLPFYPSLASLFVNGVLHAETREAVSMVAQSRLLASLEQDEPAAQTTAQQRVRAVTNQLDNFQLAYLETRVRDGRDVSVLYYFEQVRALFTENPPGFFTMDAETRDAFLQVCADRFEGGL